MSAVLNHPSSEELPAPGLQNHDAKPAEASSDTQGEGAETSSASEPQTSVHNALVAHVSVCDKKRKVFTWKPYGFYSSALIFQLFQKCRLVQRILDAWEENDKIQ